MSTASIDQIDALYIAKHILEKLQITPVVDIPEPITLPESVNTALRDLEIIEDTWEYTAPISGPSFGRKEARETIKLWSVPQKSAEVLRNLILLTGAQNILEIGTSGGYSTLHLASGTKGTVHTIELLLEKVMLARDVFEKSSLENIHLIEGEAGVVLNNWQGGKLDFVFLDADKENYGKYLQLLLPNLKAEGLIVADNINDYGHLMEDYL